MRSELVHAAMVNVPSRYLLVNVASATTRLFHRPNSQISETVNEVLNFFHRQNPIAAPVYSVSDSRMMKQTKLLAKAEQAGLIEKFEEIDYADI